MASAHDPAPADAAGYFALARRIFEDAARGGAAVRRRIDVAGADILLHFANGSLVPKLWRALSHLRVEDCGGAAGFTVRVWDGHTTGRLLPPPAWDRECYVRHGAIRGYHGSDHSVLFQPDVGMLSVVDIRRGEAVVYAMDAGAIPYYETAAPMRATLGPLLAGLGIQVIHAAAVGIPSGGVLVVGAGGSGKSTTAAACLGGRLRFLADDYCAVTAGEGPRVVSLYCTAKLRPDVLGRMPHLKGMVANMDRAGKEKPTLFLGECCPGSLLPECPIRALLVPRITGEPDTVIRPCSRAEALRCLAPSTLAQQPGADPDSFRRLAALVAKLPAYVLALGTRLEGIAPVILGLLEDRSVPCGVSP